MTTIFQASRTRKGSSLPERSNSLERERSGSRLSATLQWLANNPAVYREEQIELVLVTWHPLILKDAYCDEEIMAQQILDAAIRKCSPRSTLVCGGQRIWWLLHSGSPGLKLKQLKGRIERKISNQAITNPLFEKLGDSLIVQRMGCWNGPTTSTARGLAGMFADMAAGQSLLDNFGLPFERRCTVALRNLSTGTLSTLERKKEATKADKISKSQHSLNRSSSKRSAISQPLGSTWISAAKLPNLGQIQYYLRTFPSASIF